MMSDSLRQNIVAAQRAAQLAQQQRMLGGNIRRAGQGDPASVGACQATPWPPGGWGSGQYGSQYGPNNDLSPGLPQNAPWVPGNMLVNPCQVIQQNYTPLGFRIQANSPAGTSTTIIISPNSGGMFYVAGIRIFNQPDEIEILRISSGGADIARNAASFDAAAYNTLECFCPVDWGCISNQSPMTLTFASIGNPSTAPFINGVLFGTFQQSWNSCYPGLATALGACGPYGGLGGYAGYGGALPPVM